MKLKGKKRENRSVRSIYEALDKALMEAIESGNDPWKKGWNEIPSHLLVPYNPVTGKTYRGHNALRLTLAAANLGFTRNKGFKQARPFRGGSIGAISIDFHDIIIP